MNMDVNSVINLINKLDNVSSVDCTNDVLSLIVDSSDALKKFFAFTAYWSNLTAKNLKVCGLHEDGQLEDFDKLHDEAMKYFE